MKPNPRSIHFPSHFQKLRLKSISMIAAALLCISGARAASSIAVWDTINPVSQSGDLQNRAGWKLVPTDLLLLETNPPKASSDPAYYGRGYSFKGDIVVENQRLITLFWPAKARVAIFSKTGPSLSVDVPLGNQAVGKQIVELAPATGKSESVSAIRCELAHNAGDQVAVEISFSINGAPDASALFSFDKSEIVEIKPAGNLKTMSLSAPIEYGVAPSFIGDDLIVGGGQHGSASAISLPPENAFLGLLQGQDTLLVMTWPTGKQQLRLALGNEQEGKRFIDTVKFENDGKSFYLAALSAPGIWHREELTAAHLEKDLPIQWKRPFPAKWKTQLLEAGIKTSFAFRSSKSEIWRGVPGMYNYPVWFDGDNAFFHLSKKIPPKGEALIYFVEGQDTPASLTTPVDVIKASLGRPLSDALLDTPGRRLRTHHRRGGTGVRRACTCGCTEAIQAIFESGQEIENKDYIAQALDDMVYFVQCHVARIEEYQRFADDTVKFLQAHRNSAPELKAYLDDLEQIAEQIRQEYSVQKENMKSLGYAGELVQQTMALTARKDPQNLKAYMDLLKAWRGMGGAQDYVLAQCHAITRKLFQEAGYGCIHQPKAVELALDVRNRCRNILRNPDGYEIWPNY